MGHHRLDLNVSILLQGLMKGLNKEIHGKYSTHMENSIEYRYKVK